MRKSWIVSAALGLAVAGCKMMEPRPDPEPCADCSAPGGTAPTAPPLVIIPDTGTVPPPPGASTHIIAGLCGPTGSYVAAGVDTAARRYTFMIKGGRATQSAAFTKFYEARVPVTVYTGKVQLKGRAPTPAPAPTTPPPSPAPSLAPVPPPTEGGGSGSDALFDPCENIGEEPPPTPKPGGSNWEPTQLQAFQELSWRTAFALDAVSDPVSGISTVPVPR